MKKILLWKQRSGCLLGSLFIFPGFFKGFSRVSFQNSRVIQRPNFSVIDLQIIVRRNTPATPQNSAYGILRPEPWVALKNLKTILMPTIHGKVYLSIKPLWGQYFLSYKIFLSDREAKLKFQRIFHKNQIFSETIGQIDKS